MNPYIVLGLLLTAVLAVGAWQQKKKALLYEVTWGHQIRKTLTSKSFLLQLGGFVAFILFWQLSVKTLSLPWFDRLPGPWECLMEWLSPDPDYGISIYTEDYYTHIIFSTYRATTAFVLATLLGVPMGLLMGWSRKFYDYSFPLVELIRPIPPLAWVPLAILILPGDEPAVIFVTFLVAFLSPPSTPFWGWNPLTKATSGRPAVWGPAKSACWSTWFCPGPCLSSSLDCKYPWEPPGFPWWPAR